MSNQALTIGFDAKRAVNNLTGIGNYSRLVIEHLAKANPDHRLLLYTPKMKENPRLENIRHLDNVEFRLPPPQGFKGSLWRTFGITNHLKADKVDIFHGLSNELPLNIKGHGVKSVVTIHDLIFLTLPDTYGKIEQTVYNYKFRAACRNADRIISISECTKRDIIKYYGIEEEKISVVYQGCDDIFRSPVSPEEIARIKRRYNLPERYIIQVGTIEKRKNLELTVKALSTLPADIKLVAVGRDHLGYKKRVTRIAAETGVADRIIWLEGIPFTDLPALYSGALVSAYPSRYEGFGIPVLESLECRTPVVGATGSCLEESGGPASLYVDPHDARGMAEALQAIIQGKIDLDRIREEGKRHASKFSTAQMIQGIQAVYNSLPDTPLKKIS